MNPRTALNQPSTSFSVLRANLRSSGKRLWAAGAAIAISAAFFVTGSMLVSSMTDALTKEAEGQAAGADLIINSGLLSAESFEHGDIPLAESIEQLAEVDSAQVIRSSWLDLLSTDEGAEGDFTGEGIPVSTLVENRDYQLEAGQLPQQADELLIGSADAEYLSLEVGDTVNAGSVAWDEEGNESVLDGDVEYTVAGIEAGDGYSSEALLTAEGMERVPAEPEEGYNPTLPQELRVVLSGDGHGSAAAQEEVQLQIAELVEELIAAGELPMLASAESADSGLRDLNSFGTVSVADLEIATHQQIVDTWVAERLGDAQMMQWVAFGFGSIALFVSTLVIFNTFQVIVASRQRTMALIRAIGGTPGQLRLATLAEGALLGLFGGAVGVLLGWGVAQGFVVMMNYVDSTGEGLPSVLPSPAIIAIGVGIGLVLSVCAALVPALRAGRVSPMAALRPADVGTAEGGVSATRMISGAIVTVAGLGAVVYAALGSPDTDRPEGSYDVFNVDPVTGMPFPALGVLGAIAAFIGVLILAKAIIPPLVAALGRLLSAVGIARVSSKLAGQNARQVPGRTTATSAALLVGVTLVMTMTVGAATVQKMLYSELAESYPVDGVIVGPQAEYLPVLEDSEVVEATASVPGLQAKIAEGSEVPVLVLTEEALQDAGHLQSSELEGASAGAFADWGFDQVEHGYGGSTVELSPSAGGGLTEFPVEIATWVPAGTVVILESALPSDWEADGSAGMIIHLVEGISLAEITALEAELDSSLAAQMDDQDGSSVSLLGGTLRAEMMRVVDTMLLAVIALLGASVLVAVIGVSNTLSLSVFERKREAALLRASGMTRKSLGATISLEALLLAAVALVLGTVLGAFFAWAGVSTLTMREDWAVGLEIPWLRLAMIWGITMLAALVAAWYPARRLSRVQPAAGLSQAA